MFFQPTTLSEALERTAQGEARILAGGTDFYPVNGEKRPKGPVLDITRISALRGISHEAEEWRIGGATTWTEIARADLPPAFAGLQAAARLVGSVQIQNSGTIGGNLCNASPAADGVPPLLTLDADVELTSQSGVRRLAVADFLRGVRQTDLRAGEIVSAILVPDQGDAVAGFSKLGSRAYLVISIAMVAVWLDIDVGKIANARIAVGACSPVAQRLPALEAALVGRRSVDGVVEAHHFNELSPIDDVRGSAAYRMDVVGPMIERAVMCCLEAV